MSAQIGALVRGERGQSLVETSLSVPLLALLLVGAYEGARLLLAGIVLQTAALAGAEYGALSAANAADSAGIASAVRGEVSLPQAGPTNPVVVSTTARDANDELVVTVRGTFTLTTLVPYPGVPRTFVISRSATLQVRR